MAETNRAHLAMLSIVWIYSTHCKDLGQRNKTCDILTNRRTLGYNMISGWRKRNAKIVASFILGAVFDINLKLELSLEEQSQR